MKHLSIFGLFLFVCAFVLFVSMFFMSRHQLTPQLLRKHLQAEEKAAHFAQRHASVLHKTFSSNTSFIRALRKALGAYNEDALATYGLGPQDIDYLVAANSSLTFRTASFDGLPAAAPDVLSFKKDALQAYGGWLEGATFPTTEALSLQLSSLAQKIARYEVLKQKGFDAYAIDRVVYGLTKDTTISPVRQYPVLFLFLTYGLGVLGALLYLLPKISLDGPPGIRNNGIFHSALKNRGWLGILLGTFLILFYFLLYFRAEYVTNWVVSVDPISRLLSGHEAGKFFMYGYLYTLCVLVMGVRMIIHYRGNAYQVVRTVSVMFFQLCFAFLIPEILIRLNKPYFDFKNIWPLDYDFFFETELSKLIAGGNLGLFMLGWGLALIALGVPIFTYFFGKRWYCSWVCGCGGLAETLGDPFRQLSNKTLRAWKIERWSIHAVLVFAVVMTIGVLYTYWSGHSELFGLNTYRVRQWYGAGIGAIFSGVVGTGFYPLMGSRVWCRFGCPLAAYLGLVQRFKSRFRITTNGGQCISCGNCSTYCEMGIDVRWYAQRGQNIIRSSCVGCGICSAVCPRGVLNLETKKEQGRFLPSAPMQREGQAHSL